MELCRWDFAELISIHALREEGDKITFADLGWYEVFLSTPSARRATDVRPVDANELLFLSTPSARRATRQGCTALFGFLISIHALREEGDTLPRR